MRHAIFGTLIFLCAVLAGCGESEEIEGPLASTPLAGVNAHDFGPVQLGNVKQQLRHDFVLTNTTNMTLRIGAVQSSCGCTSLKISTKTILPSEQLTIGATLTVADVGTRKARIWVELLDGDDSRTHTLHLQATGTRQTGGYVSHAHLVSDDRGRSHAYVFWIDSVGTGKPARPRGTGPSSATIDIGDWALVHQLDLASGRPTRWMARIDVVKQSAAPTTLQVTLHDNSTFPLVIDGSPFM